MNLDDCARFGGLDAAGVLADVAGSADQWAAARAAAPPPVDLAGVDSVVIVGVGGSGLAGDVVAAVAADRLPVPVLVHKGYGLPAHIGPRSLVVAVSCSGDTEETCAAAAEARQRGAQLLAVAAGGRLPQLVAQEAGEAILVDRAGQPRHSLGYLTVPVLAALGLDEAVDEAVAVQQSLCSRLAPEVPRARNPAKRLAEQLAAHPGVPVVYGLAGLGTVAAYRLKCQLNENAKMPALAGELPEVAHNEIAGWAAAPQAPGLVTVRDHAGEDDRLSRRLEALVDELGDTFAWSEEVAAVGTAPLARLAGLVLHVDFVSVYAALARDHDPNPITAVERVKGAVAG